MKLSTILKPAVLAIIVATAGIAAEAQTTITLRTPGPTRAAMQEILPKFEAKTGYKVDASYGNGVGTKAEAAKGEPYDVFVILPPYKEALASDNLVNGSKTTIGRFVLAITVKKGSPLPDISTTASTKKTLLAAKSLATVDPTKGSVGVATGEAVQKLGIASEMKDRIEYVDNGGLVGKAVTDGKAEIGMGPYVSDLEENRNPDLVVVGPLPAGASTPTDIDAFMSSKAKDPKACKALLEFLKSPEAEAIYKAHGIMPVK